MKKIFVIFVALFTITACSDPMNNSTSAKKSDLSYYEGEFAYTESDIRPKLTIRYIADDNGEGLIIKNIDDNIKMVCTKDKILVTERYVFEERTQLMMDCTGVIGDSRKESDLRQWYLGLVRFDDGVLIILYPDGKENFDKNDCFTNPECDSMFKPYVRMDKDMKNDEFNEKNYIGTFNESKLGSGKKDPKLVLKKKGKKFRVINQRYDGGEYLCVIDRKVDYVWGDESHLCLYLDCETISHNSNSIRKNEFQKPYITLCHSIEVFNNKDFGYTSNYDYIEYSRYLKGKEYYKKCSSDANSQECDFESYDFYRPRTKE